MIGEDRIKLNERFIKVFNLLQERNVIVLNDRDGKGMGDFAHRILGNRAYGHIVRAFLNANDKRTIDYHHIKALCKEYGVNEQYMLYGIGTPFGMNLPEIDPVMASTGKGNILFTTVQAFAGSTVDTGGFAKEDNEYFGVPGVAGSGFVAFPISGNSMEPVIKHGDIVVCKEVASFNDIKDNEIYAVKSNGSVWIKYVQRIFNPQRRITRLKLISANYLEHDPFEEDVNEYTRLYKVTKRISNL